MQSIEAKTDATTLEQGALGAPGVDTCEYSNRICQIKVFFSSLTTINNSTEQMRRLYTNPPFMLSSLTGYRQYHSCTTDINYFRILKRKVSQRFVLTEAWRSKHQLFSHSGKLNLWRQIFFVSLSHRRRASVSFEDNRTLYCLYWIHYTPDVVNR